MDRCVIYGRDNQQITSWNFANNLLTLFPESGWAQVRGVDNVIDIILIGPNRVARSCSPNVFKDKSNEKDWGCSGRDKNWSVISNSNNENPFQICALSDFNTLPSVVNGTNNGSEWINTFNDNRASVAAMRYDDIYDSKDRDYGDKSLKVTSLSKLYHGMEMLQYAMHRGYRLFEPDNLMHWKNWNAINLKVDGKYWHHYVLVMYLDARTAALDMGCFNVNRIPSSNDAVRALFNSTSLSNKSIMKNMAKETCSTSQPSYSKLPQGNYFMGTTIYSSNTMFKCMLQPDGNFVLYRMGNGSDITEVTAVWSSDTNCKEYTGSKYKKTLQFHRPRLAIQTDGNMVLYSRDDVAVWFTGTSGKGRDVVAYCASTLHLFNQGDPYKILWSSTSNWGSWISTFLKFPYLIESRTCIIGEDANKLVDESDYSTLRATQADYCMEGDNMINDPRCFKTFRNEVTYDDTNHTIKKKVTDYINAKYCTSESAVSNSSDAIKKMCSCRFPYDDKAKELVRAGASLYCAPSCLDDGFIDPEKAPKGGCPTCLNVINVRNASAKDIEQACIINTQTTTSTNTQADNTQQTDSKAQAGTTNGATSTNNSSSTANTNGSSSSSSSTTVDGSPVNSKSGDNTAANNPPANTSADEKKKQEQLYYILGFVLVLVLLVAFIAKRRANYNPQQYTMQMDMMQPMDMSMGM